MQTDPLYVQYTSKLCKEKNGMVVHCLTWKYNLVL